MAKTSVVAGRVFGRLTVLGHASPSITKSGRRLPRVECRCECGRQINVFRDSLLTGNTRSCGCLRTEGIVKRSVTHGATRSGKNTPEYRTWICMVGRCGLKNKNTARTRCYKGIDVCERWRQSFKSFLDDMGLKPTPQHSIDRIDGTKGYEPGNCRWATPAEQARNTKRNIRLTFYGVSKTLTEWSAISQVAVGTTWNRLNVLKMEPKQAVWTPVKRKANRG